MSQVDLSKTLFHSGFNAFKNDNLFQGTLTLPSSLANNTEYTDTVSFTVAQSDNFMQAYIYSTDYNDSFRYLDDNYHDYWHALNVSESNLLFDNATFLWFYDVTINKVDDIITATLYIENSSGSTLTYDHPTFEVPVAFVDYSLAN